jgi:hypothetical protein
MLESVGFLGGPLSVTRSLMRIPGRLDAGGAGGGGVLPPSRGGGG